jgi:hypothetical protein
MDDGFDLDAALARLPQPSLAEMLRAQREAELTPPPATTIPQPEFPHPLRSILGGTVRYHCPLDCGWYHDARPDDEPMGPLLLPAGFTTEDLSEAVSSQAAVRVNNHRLHVEQAIQEHFDASHPGR